MRFSPEGIPNCGADVAIWSIGVTDPDSQIFNRTGTTDFEALISCASCPLDGVELPNAQLPRVSELQLQEFLDTNCPKAPSQRPQFDIPLTQLPLEQ